MEAQTFKSRLISLLQRSRQAARMYSEMRRSNDKLNYADLQIKEWKNINLELVDELSILLDDFYDQKILIAKSFALLERFQIEQVSISTILQKKKDELSLAINKDDFAKSAKLSLELVSLKSRNQALEAVLNELNRMLEKCNITSPKIKKEIKKENDIKDKSERTPFVIKSNLDKVIPINVARKA